jgi:putative oxidoreductase
MNLQKRLSWALLGLRLSIFLVMLMWTLDKFVRPEHSAGVFTHFYAVSGLSSSIFLAIGALELILLLAFVIGFARRYSYGAVLLLHAISTLSAWHQYTQPYQGSNLLFFAAWPMLAGCMALYLLRDADTMTLAGRTRATPGRSGRGALST